MGASVNCNERVFIKWSGTERRPAVGCIVWLDRLVKSTVVYLEIQLLHMQRSVSRNVIYTEDVARVLLEVKCAPEGLHGFAAELASVIPNASFKASLGKLRSPSKRR